MKFSNEAFVTTALAEKIPPEKERSLGSSLARQVARFRGFNSMMNITEVVVLNA